MVSLFEFVVELDVVLGEAVWEFQTIDPVTGTSIL